MKKTKADKLRKIALVSVFSAIAFTISPFYFQWGVTKAFPGQHLVNVLTGILLGPTWAIFSSLIIGTIRIMLGTGTFFAYPGGMPGGLTVGITYIVLKKTVGKRWALIISPMTEPIGTVLIGGTISWYLLDPLFGSRMSQLFISIIPFYYGWALSSITGAVIGLLVLLTLNKTGVIRLVLGEEA
ncbi:MAG: energy coupling factor transporter S component ThiW [Nitrososphaeria archaeon]